MSKYITVIGSRETPEWVLEEMKRIMNEHIEEGYIVRSGGAAGADHVATQFAPPEYREIYLPWDSFNGLYHNGKDILRWDFSPVKKDATATAQEVRDILGAPPLTKQSHINFHSRNMMQVLGYNLDTPSDVVLCYTDGARMIGGTASAIMLARLLEIKIINLGIAKGGKL
jgi:hypothetical protein